MHTHTHIHIHFDYFYIFYLYIFIILCIHACVYVGECVTDVYNFRWFAVSWPVDLQVTFIFCVWCVNIDANTLTQTSIYVYLCKQINRHTHKHTFRRIYIVAFIVGCIALIYQLTLHIQKCRKIQLKYYFYYSYCCYF